MPFLFKAKKLVSVSDVNYYCVVSFGYPRVWNCCRFYLKQGKFHLKQGGKRKKGSCYQWDKELMLSYRKSNMEMV